MISVMVGEKKRAEILARHADGECAADIASHVRLKIVSVIRVIRRAEEEKATPKNPPPKPPYLPTPEEIKQKALFIRTRGFVNDRGEWRPPWDAAIERKRNVYGEEPATFPEMDAAFYHRVSTLRSAELKEMEDDYLAWVIQRGLTE